MSTKPATAYDYRWYIELVQAAASEHPEQALRALCEAWNINPVYFDSLHMNIGDTWVALAKAAIKHHREAVE